MCGFIIHYVLGISLRNDVQLVSYAELCGKQHIVRFGKQGSLGQAVQDMDVMAVDDRPRQADGFTVASYTISSKNVRGTRGLLLVQFMYTLIHFKWPFKSLGRAGEQRAIVDSL